MQDGIDNGVSIFEGLLGFIEVITGLICCGWRPKIPNIPCCAWGPIISLLGLLLGGNGTGTETGTETQ